MEPNDFDDAREAEVTILVVSVPARASASVANSAIPEVEVLAAGVAVFDN